jgi:putative nucleotidyltransferase with HDIG domain
MATSTLDINDVRRRVPTLSLIDDPDICEETARLTAAAPEYFWRVPASKNSFHHPICREEHGLWVHTLMLSTVIERLADSYVEQGRLTREEIDYAHAAAILHDQRKNGDRANPSETSTSNHDNQMALVVYGSGLPEAVGDAIASHMGPWYDGPQPESDLDDLVHTADMVASTETITPAVAAPIPEELSHFDLQAADLD